MATTIFQGKDGELRILSNGHVYGAEPSGTTYYLEVLFSQMDFTGPTARPRTGETLIMDRGNADTNMHYIESNDEPRYAPLPFSFSCKIADTVDTRVLIEWLSGTTKINNVAGGSTEIYTWKGSTSIDGNTLPAFKESPPKMAYRVEMKWDGENDYGLRYEECYFPPGEQTITEAADGITLSGNGQIYGGVTRITAFYSGTSVRAFV